MDCGRTRSMGGVETWIRFGIGALAFCGAALPLFVVLVLLLPFRRLRLRVGGLFARTLGGALMRIAGVRLRVRNGGRLRDPRPGLFVINHNSAVDTFASMAVWPPAAVAIGKKEVLFIPFFGWAWVLMGNVLVDRGDHERAVASVRRATERLRSRRLSVWMAPEGTRSRDGRLGPFKKGFVHIAVAAGLPVVPVVLRGAASCWPVDTFDLGAGTVELEVLEELSTEGWSIETLDRHVAEVRSRFLEALGEG